MYTAEPADIAVLSWTKKSSIKNSYQYVNEKIQNKFQQHS